MTLKTAPGFEKVVEENKDIIYRICNSYTVLPLDAKDLFQEVLYQLWKSFPSFQGNSAVSTWVYRITLNVCIRSQQKLKKNKALIQTFESIQFLAPPKAPENEEELNKLNILQACISNLNSGDHSIIVLYLEELSYKQIAEVTGLTENHIAVKMKRIKKKLLDCITPKLK